MHMAVEADRAERGSGRLDWAGYCCFVDYDTRGGMRKGSVDEDDDTRHQGRVVLFSLHCLPGL